MSSDECRQDSRETPNDESLEGSNTGHLSQRTCEEPDCYIIDCSHQPKQQELQADSKDRHSELSLTEPKQTTREIPDCLDDRKDDSTHPFVVDVVDDVDDVVVQQDPLEVSDILTQIREVWEDYYLRNWLPEKPSQLSKDLVDLFKKRDQVDSKKVKTNPWDNNNKKLLIMKPKRWDHMSEAVASVLRKQLFQVYQESKQQHYVCQEVCPNCMKVKKITLQKLLETIIICPRCRETVLCEEFLDELFKCLQLNIQGKINTKMEQLEQCLKKHGPTGLSVFLDGLRSDDKQDRGEAPLGKRRPSTLERGEKKPKFPLTIQESYVCLVNICNEALYLPDSKIKDKVIKHKVKAVFDPIFEQKLKNLKQPYEKQAVKKGYKIATGYPLKPNIRKQKDTWFQFYAILK